MSFYTSLVIHVFSGTGNSLRVVDWLAGFFGRDRARIVRIGKMGNPGQAPGAGSITGIVFPTHGFTAPWAVLRHALRLPPGKGEAAFIVATRAGTWPGFLLPGLSGSAMYVVTFILLCKGYRIAGFRGLDMPSNWTSLHWGISRENAEKIIGKGRSHIERFAGKIFHGGQHLLSFNNIIELAFGAMLVPVSAGYLLIGRFGLAKLFYANWKCNSCGQCARDCPMGAIVMKGRDIKRPYWTFSCESCMHCMGYCPEEAVEASHPLAIALYFICTFSLSGFLGAFLVNANAGAALLGSAVLDPWVQMLLDYAYIIISFALVYAIFYYLVRIPVVNRAFSYLTLTHYYRRYHEPDMTGKDFTEGSPSEDRSAPGSKT